MRVAIGDHGFCLSQEALKRLIELGIPSKELKLTDDWNHDYNAVLKGYFCQHPDWLMCRFDDEHRSDPRLLQVIDELGSAAGGSCEPDGHICAIAIVEIPDGVGFFIDQHENLQFESIEEYPRIWRFPGYTCPVCGFVGLSEPAFRKPYRDDEPICKGGTFEICVSCGTEFGLNSGFSLKEIRQSWIDEGMKWHSQRTPPPPGWSAKEQLKRIGVNVE